jgi:hypothetical protein
VKSYVTQRGEHHLRLHGSTNTDDYVYSTSSQSQTGSHTSCTLPLSQVDLRLHGSMKSSMWYAASQAPMQTYEEDGKPCSLALLLSVVNAISACTA